MDLDGLTVVRRRVNTGCHKLIYGRGIRKEGNESAISPLWYGTWNGIYDVTMSKIVGFQRKSRGKAVDIREYLIYLFLFSMAASKAVAALGIDASMSTTFLTADITGENIISTTNRSLTNQPYAVGYFTGGLSSIGFDTGVVLSAGTIAFARGPRVGCGGGQNRYSPGDTDLDALAGYATHDAMVMEFDFVPNGSEVKVDFVYASNEYHDFPPNTYPPNVFAIYINGGNIAQVPGTSTPISVSTINGGYFPQYYRDNICTGHAYDDTSLNGFTVTMTASAQVTPCVSNHFKWAIADSDVWSADSDVFIRTGGFRVVDATVATTLLAESSVVVGSPIAYYIGCSNTSETTAYNLTIWDTIPAGSAFISASPGGSFDGSKILWSISSIPPLASASVSFTVLFLENSPSSAQNTACVLRPMACPGYWQFSSDTIDTAILHGSPALHKTVMPSGPACSGQTVTYTVSWYNNGNGTTFGITITDTLPDGVKYSGASMEYFAQDDWLGTPVLSGSAYAASIAGPWIAGEPPDGTTNPLVLRWTIDRIAPGSSGTIRYGVVIPPTLPSSGSVTNRASATALWDSSVHLSEITSNLTASALAGRLRAFPVIRDTGQDFIVTLTVTNNGCATASGLAIQLPGSNGSGTAAYKDGPWPALPPSLGGGASFSLTWTYTGISPGTVWLTCSVQGTDDSTSLDVSTGMIAGNTISILRPAELLAVLTITPGIPCFGVNHLVMITVSNTGQAAAQIGVVGPLVATGSGITTILSGPFPPPPLSINGGSRITFTWTAQGIGTGTVQYSATVEGTDAVSTAPITTGTLAAGTTIYSLGTVDSALFLPAEVSSGQWMKAFLTVTNTGESRVTGITGALTASPGTMAVLKSGPIPAGPVPLSPGASQTFTWTYSMSGTGSLSFSSTATGQACNGSIVMARADGATSVVKPAALGVSLSISGTPVTIGQWFTVVVSVTNTGGATSVSVVPALALSSGQLALICGPSPASAPSLPAGSTASFTWTWSVSGSASIIFTSSANGSDVNSGSALGVSLVSSLPITVYNPARIEKVSFSMTPGPVEKVGDSAKATLVLRNTGGTMATIGSIETGCILSQLAIFGPPTAVSPAPPVTLNGNASRTFTWIYPATGCGTASTTVTVTGSEAGTGRNLPSLWARSSTISVAGAPANISIMPAVLRAPAGTPVSLIAYLTDNCGIGVPGISISFSSLSDSAVSPAQDITDLNGQSHANLTLGIEPGIYAVGASLPAAGLSATTAVEATAGLMTLPSVGAALSANEFSPQRGDTVVVRVHLADDKPVKVSIFTASGLIVRTLSTYQSIGMGQIGAVWDGKSNEGTSVARGVYLIQVFTGSKKYLLKVLVK